MYCEQPHRVAGIVGRIGMMSLPGRWAAVFMLVLALGPLCRPLAAQGDISASLAGTVADQNGGVVAGAVVLVRNAQTGVTSQTTASETAFTSLFLCRQPHIPSPGG